MEELGWVNWWQADDGAAALCELVALLTSSRCAWLPPVHLPARSRPHSGGFGVEVPAQPAPRAL